jgi:ubiquinone/menaquinone biosynthesis C-methylase UbiE
MGAMERLFNFPRLYRAKFALTGAAVAITRPVLFRNYFTFKGLLAEHIRTGQRVCEIGCGDGENYRLLRDAVGSVDYTGVDVNPNMIQHCRQQHPEARWICGEDLPSCGFDTCIICNLLHHLETRSRVIHVVRTASRLAGEVLLFEPLQSENRLLAVLKSGYWASTDGGKLYLRLAEFHEVFAEAGAHVGWEVISEPLRQFYSCQLLRDGD